MSEIKNLRKFQNIMFKLAYCSSIAFIAFGAQAVLTPAILPLLVPIVAVLATSSAACALAGHVIEKGIAKRAENLARVGFSGYSQTNVPRTGRRIGSKEPARDSFNSAAPRDQQCNLGFAEALKRNAEMQFRSRQR